MQACRDSNWIVINKSRTLCHASSPIATVRPHHTNTQVVALAAGVIKCNFQDCDAGPQCSNNSTSKLLDTIVRHVPSHDLRSASNELFAIPRIKTSLGDKVFSHATSSIWNGISQPAGQCKLYWHSENIWKIIFSRSTLNLIYGIPHMRMTIGHIWRDTNVIYLRTYLKYLSHVKCERCVSDWCILLRVLSVITVILNRTFVMECWDCVQHHKIVVVR